MRWWITNANGLLFFTNPRLNNYVAFVPRVLAHDVVYGIDVGGIRGRRMLHLNAHHFTNVIKDSVSSFVQNISPPVVAQRI